VILIEKRRRKFVKTGKSGNEDRGKYLWQPEKAVKGKGTARREIKRKKRVLHTTTRGGDEISLTRKTN